MKQACTLHPLGIMLKAACCHLPCSPIGADGWGTVPTQPTDPLGSAERGRNPSSHKGLISLHLLRTVGEVLPAIKWGDLNFGTPNLGQDLTEEVSSFLKIHLYGEGSAVIALNYIKSSLLTDLVNCFTEKKAKKGKSVESPDMKTILPFLFFVLSAGSCQIAIYKLACFILPPAMPESPSLFSHGLTKSGVSRSL